MKVRVNSERCKGYGLCVGTCPEVFDFSESGLAVVLEPFAQRVPAALRDKVLAAERTCPQHAIEVEEGEAS
jgi:ferredoxin